jgi:hypothetical protein
VEEIQSKEEHDNRIHQPHSSAGGAATG